MLINALIVLATVVFMELFSIVAHKYVMHGFGWGWHRSHHEPRTGWFEKNDLYAVVFAGIAIVLIYLGSEGRHPLEWIGAGMTAYGLLYFIAHDGLVHQRWPFHYVPKQRLPEAAVPGAPHAPRRAWQGGRRVVRLPVRATGHATQTAAAGAAWRAAA